MNLSSEGRRRREEILREAVLQAIRRRRRRRVAQSAAFVVFLTILVTAPRIHRPLRQTAEPVVEKTPAAAPVIAQGDGAMIVVSTIQTDPTVADRLRLQTEKPHWQPLSDQELLDVLAANGQTAGLAYVNGQAELLTR